MHASGGSKANTTKTSPTNATYRGTWNGSNHSARNSTNHGPWNSTTNSTSHITQDSAGDGTCNTPDPATTLHAAPCTTDPLMKTGWNTSS
jgi:hypothetical protein